MIKIKNLVKQYKKTNVKTLNHVNLTIEKGMYGLLGSNGAGKSTLMNILSTQLPMTSGEIIMNEIKMQAKNLADIRKQIGYMPQEIGMYPEFTVYEAFDYFGVLNGMESGKRKNRVEELLGYTNLEAHRNKKFKNLSGGMKRRVGLGVALIHNPPILIVDEPTTGIDPNERINMRTLLMSLAENKIVLLSTHIIEDISYTCNNMAILVEGEVKYEGTVNSLLNKAKNIIWNYTINDYDEVKEIARNNIVLNVSSQGAERKIKILSENKPFSGAQLAVPSLEDAFIAVERIVLK